MSEIDLSFVDATVARLGRGPEMTIPILQALQEHYRYLPEEALRRVCRETEITPAQIAGVATFYNQFRLNPPGKHQVQICRGTACHVKGSFNLLETLQRELGIEAGATTRDGLFSLEVVACLEACSIAPVMTVREIKVRELRA